MSKNKILFIGAKESFISRVLIKKVKEAGVDVCFVPWTVDRINASLDNVSLITLFMDDGERPGEDVLHFLVDIMDEKGLQTVLAGEQQDILFVQDNFPDGLVYKTF